MERLHGGKLNRKLIKSDSKVGQLEQKFPSPCLISTKDIVSILKMQLQVWHIQKTF